MQILATENRIQALQTMNRMQAAALIEFNARAQFYSIHTDLLVMLNHFAAARHVRVGLSEFIDNKHPKVTLLIDIEDMQSVSRELKQLFSTLPGRLEEINGELFEFYGLQHMSAAPARMTIVLKGH